MHDRHLVLPLLALLLLLSACGQSATASQAPVPAVRPRPAPTTAVPELGRQVLEAVRQRLASCQGFDTEMTSWAEGTWDDGEDKGVQRTNRNRARLRWDKPNRLHGEMLEAPIGLMVGGTLDTADGQTLTLRPSGLLSVVAMKVSATDIKLRNSRNHTFRDAQPAAQLQRLTASTAAWKVIGRDAASLTLEVEGVRRLDAGIEREVLTVSPTDLSLKSLTMVADRRTVVSNTFTQFRWR